MAPHSSTLAWKNPMDGGAWWATVHGVAKSRTRLSNFTFTSHFHALEKEMATHSSVLAWRIPGTGEPGGLPSMGSHRVGHNWSDLAAAVAAAATGWISPDSNSSELYTIWDMFLLCFHWVIKKILLFLFYKIYLIGEYFTVLWWFLPYTNMIWENSTETYTLLFLLNIHLLFLISATKD